MHVVTSDFIHLGLEMGLLARELFSAAGSQPGGILIQTLLTQGINCGSGDGPQFMHDSAASARFDDAQVCPGGDWRVLRE